MKTMKSLRYIVLLLVVVISSCEEESSMNEILEPESSFETSKTDMVKNLSPVPTLVWIKGPRYYSTFGSQVTLEADVVGGNPTNNNHYQWVEFNPDGSTTVLSSGSSNELSITFDRCNARKFRVIVNGDTDVFDYHMVAPLYNGENDCCSSGRNQSHPGSSCKLAVWITDETGLDREHQLGTNEFRAHLSNNATQVVSWRRRDYVNGTWTNWKSVPAISSLYFYSPNTLGPVIQLEASIGGFVHDNHYSVPGE